MKTTRAGVMIAVVMFSGCMSAPRERVDEVRFAANPFAPKSVRVHPLTQIDPAPKRADGTPDPLPRIIVHLEVKDRFGDTVKALGTFHADLFRSGATSTSAMEQKVADWTEASFMDAERNTGRFDPATRTYRIQLTAPSMVGAWKAGREQGGLRLRVTYTTGDEAGREVVLEDSYNLPR